MITFYRFSIPCLFLFGSLTIFGQNCTQTLRSAERAYTEGRIAEIPTILDICLRGGFTKTERIRAYRLLTLSYLYQYETASAEKAMLRFLQEAPDYKIDPNDPAPFVKLYKRFRTTPIFLIGLRTGINFAQIQAFQGRSVLGNDYGKNTSRIGFLAGISGQVALLNKLSIDAGLLFRLNRTNVFSKGGDLSYSTQPEGTITGSTPSTQVNTDISQSEISLPVIGKYEVWKRGDLSVFGELGGAVSFVLQKDAAIGPQILKGNDNPETPSPTSQQVMRKNFNFAVIPGVGLKYKLGRNYFVFDIRYWIGLNNQTKNPWQQNDQYRGAFDNAYVPDDYRMNNMTISVGYLFPIYKPKLIKK